MSTPSEPPAPERQPDTPGGAPAAGTTAVDTRSNGHATPSAVPGPPPRRPPGPSTRYALVVLGLTLVVFAIGIGLELASGTQSRPTPSPPSVVTARGAGLHAVPARPLLGPIVSGGQPPDDLLDALAVPRGSTAVAGSALDQGVEAYDRSLRLDVSASQAAVIAFFRAELPAEHWKVVSQGPAKTSSYLILAQHPASDGHEWELGVTVSPTVFTLPGAGVTTRAQTTPFTVRLFPRSSQD